MKSKFMEYYNSLTLQEKDSFKNACLMCFNILGSAIAEYHENEMFKSEDILRKVLSCLIKEADDVVNGRKEEENERSVQ